MARASRGAAVSARLESAEHRARGALDDARRHLQRSALKLVGYLLLAYVVLKAIPALKDALSSLEHVRWEWVLGALGLEILSETGFVVAWKAIVDPDGLLSGEGRDGRMDMRVAWAQLGGGLLLPGGSWGGVGVGTWILHRFGMPTELAVERQFNLSFLNTAVDALALIVFGLALATGVLPGSRDPLLTLLPAGVTAIAIVSVVLMAARVRPDTGRLSRHRRVASSIATLSKAVKDTRLLFHTRSYRAILGVLAYLGFDVVVLWSAFLAIHANPVPGFAVVVMAYIIGALGGSIPLPAGIGTVGGIAGMLILYGVGHSPAVAAVVLHQAIGLLVPVAGGAIAYAVVRRRLGPIRARADERKG
jgi:uncharacterized membrane protein YbhN (UPF0104 family)